MSSYINFRVYIGDKEEWHRCCNECTISWGHQMLQYLYRVVKQSMTHSIKFSVIFLNFKHLLFCFPERILYTASNDEQNVGSTQANLEASWTGVMISEWPTMTSKLTGELVPKKLFTKRNSCDRIKQDHKSQLFYGTSSKYGTAWAQLPTAE